MKKTTPCFNESAVQPNWTSRFHFTQVRAVIQRLEVIRSSLSVTTKKLGTALAHGSDGYVFLPAMRNLARKIQNKRLNQGVNKMSIAIDAALSGLRAAQQSLDVVSNNVANASTQGYTRKILPLQTAVIGGTAHGVTLSAIKRNVDTLLIRDLAMQTGVSEAQSVTQSYLDRIQQFNGASDANQSLAASISGLSQSFADLSNAPNDLLGLQKTLTAATTTAKKFNDFSNLLTQMRNQTENEIRSNITEVNQALQTVASLNSRINALKSAGQSSADLEDQRDQAVQTVSKYIQVSVYSADNGKVILTTKQGASLADDTAAQITFQPGNNLLPTSFYPGGGVNGIFVNGVDITATGLGGAIGALVDLRDNTLPTYGAQLDELAQKLADRINQQGLKLFTDLSGNVPANVPSPGIVGYVGFASQIQVNPNVLANSTLIRSGTNGNTVLSGSNEVIRKVAQFAFGATAYQQAQGTADISAGTVFASTGMQPVNRQIGNANIAGYTPTLTANTSIVAGSQFTLTIGGVPQIITIVGTDTATNLVANINAAFGSTVASLNGLGQLVINSNSAITFSNGTLGAAGLAALGFTAGAYPAQNPSFTLQVGTQAPVTITITAADTAATILTQLNAISGLTASLNVNGQLVLTPKEGGDLKLTDGVGAPVAALGLTLSNVSPTPFRQTNLGPGGTLSTGLLANATLEDFTRSIIQGQSEDASTTQANAQKEQTYLQLLDKRNTDKSGVNIDEEMSIMIRIQSNYSAAAKMLTTAEKMLDDLMHAF
jgi:flagellar hook-associated protein 1 FlgK